MIKKNIILCISAAMVLCGVLPVNAQSDQPADAKAAGEMAADAMPFEQLSGVEAIERRQQLMKLAGMTMKAAGSASGEEASAAGKTLVDSFTELQYLFPEDSKTGADTEALPLIWEQKADFEVKMTAALDAATGLLQAAQGGDQQAYLASIKAMGQTCGGCHNAGYRAK